MTDEVKFIFKTLLKVPVIILVCYAILNLFSFFFIYFKALGASYVVMQVAVENNYLPATELKELYAYVDEWNDIPMCNNATIVVGGTSSHPSIVHEEADGSPKTSAEYTEDARRRKQYGNTVTCGVTCDYTIVWPLSHREQLDGAGLDSKVGETGDTVGVAGANASRTNPGFNSETELEAMRNAKRAGIPITLVYTVPGLKYYPDMITH